MAEISINPSLTTNAAGSFNVQSLGFIQGLARDDPAVRNELAGGYLDAAETVPMWGGVAIEELIAAVTESRGPSIKRATTNPLLATSTSAADAMPAEKVELKATHDCALIVVCAWT